ncbi:hypothetical protein [Fluviispira multicolorata]|uniref:Uncharacterized protein n=1 Tax=Fluviispira multicolorata TaxID=2654512 RepID=A0A833JBR1_9BACT|nr:hypothetical protein [Fluviispira multicolorata]KAB8029041.1 hypothetical protein GCL57_10895 [Fluviispira multicolorata]
MQKTKLLLIGLGFFWIFAWSIFGSVLGSRIEIMSATNADPTWLIGWQRTLLRSAHAHMNLMGITTLLIALTLSHIKIYLPRKYVSIIIIVNSLSIPIFGLGIVLQAFFPNANGNISPVTAIAALGGILYIITIGIWSALFIFTAMKKHN